MSLKHKSYVSRRSGLIISKLCNFFAVSPDAVCECTCGKFVLEIKCPYCLKDPDSTVEDLLNLTDPYVLVENGEYVLNKSHDYYFQIQMEMVQQFYPSLSGTI